MPSPTVQPNTSRATTSRAWLILGSAFLAFTVGASVMHSYTVFLLAFVADFGWSPLVPLRSMPAPEPDMPAMAVRLRPAPLDVAPVVGDPMFSLRPAPGWVRVESAADRPLCKEPTRRLFWT